MNKILTIITVFCLSLNLGAQTNIYNKQEVSGTWTKSGSPYRINGEAVVRAGQTLTIEPGVKVLFKTGSNEDYAKDDFNLGMLRVKGELIANGSENDRIIFSRQGDSGNWGSIIIENNQNNSSMSYCRIEYGNMIYSAVKESSVASYGAVAIHFSKLKLSNCVFYKNAFWSLFPANSSIEVTNCTFNSNNSYDIYNHVSDVVVKNSILENIGNTSGTCSISYSLIKTNIKNNDYKQTNNIYERDPMFVDQSNGDFNLKSSSPCIGAGEYGVNMGAYGKGKTQVANNSNSKSSSKSGSSYISDKQEVSGTWTKSGSPYYINGEAIVGAGQTLTIEPGVSVLFKTGSQEDYSKNGFDLGMLRVKGELIANGSENDKITFSRQGDNGNWGSIIIENNQNNSSMSYCVIKYGNMIYSAVKESSVASYGAVAIHFSKLKLFNCIFYKNAFWSLFPANSSIEVTNCTFNSNNSYDIYNHVSDVIVKNSILDNIGNSSGTCSISNSLIKTNIKDKDYKQTNNIYEKDPMFVDPANNDFTLRSNSPCIGTGENGIDMGASGKIRWQVNSKIVSVVNDIDLTGDWDRNNGNCVSLKKDGNDYLVETCGTAFSTYKYISIGDNKFKTSWNNAIFKVIDANHVEFVEGSTEKWTRKNPVEASKDKIAAVKNAFSNDKDNNSDFMTNLPPILSIQDISLSKNVLNANETAKLSITLKNIGAGDANGVYVNLSSDMTGLVFASKTNFPVIAKSNGSQTVSIDIKGGMDLPTGEAVLKIEIVEPNFKVKIQGKQVKFPTREFLKPELLLAKFAVVENLSANPNNQIDINEQIDVKFAVQNVGQGDAEDVNIAVSNNQTGVMLLGVVDNTGNLVRKNPSFNSITSGKFESVTYRYFVNSEFTSSQLTFTINATEKNNKFGFNQSKSVEINKTLQEEGYIRTVAVNDNPVKGKVVIEDIPDFVSDVDQNIPSSTIVNDKTFAVVIGNETYSKEIQVKHALNDARIFKQYLLKTLGLPANNIHYVENATYGQILDALKWINDVIKAYNGQAKIIFYYAGHGMPDEQSKSAFILPVDGNSQNTASAVKLADVYGKLTEFPSASVTVFLDACFSGATRETNGTMLADGRGVKIKPKTDLLTGNLVVFSAATGDETAFPYAEKQHGMFTYFLLKKLQDTKGAATLNELSSYVITNVTQQSVVVNKKSQTPQVNTSSQVQDAWQTMKLK